MRLSLIVLAAVAIVGLSASVQAQETGVPVSFDTAGAATRTPTLIVRELPRGNGDSEPTSETEQVAEGQKPIIIPGQRSRASGSLSAGTGNPEYDKLILDSATRHGVDPNLIVAVMRQESGFKPRARSHKGATGLMQLMPATARRFGVTNIYDPAQNIEGGTKYLRFLLDLFQGDVSLSLAGYNAGENAVIRHGYRIPPYRETQNYVRSITARYGNDTVIAKREMPAGPVAPEAISFSSQSGSRLSNNY